MYRLWTQFYPPPPSFTEQDLVDLSDRVFIVTGGYSGVGFELVKILYSKNATVWIAGRSKDKAEQSIIDARAAAVSSKGNLKFLYLDLGDLTTIKTSAQTFLDSESRLDVLWNNAGVMDPPAGSKTTQGYELQLGTNCLGPFLFTQLLLPLLATTAATAPENSVRVTWTSSLVAELATPKGVINFDDINMELSGSSGQKYGQSKAGNIFIGYEFAKRVKERGIISLVLNPGNLKSPLQRHSGVLMRTFGTWMLHPPVFGAYTELFSGLSEDITMKDSGSYIIPWGRIGSLHKELKAGTKTEAEGGTGVGKKFYEWCEAEVDRYM